MAKRWIHRPPHSNWGDFGLDDEIGRLNLITDERRLAAAREVKDGRAFCLSLPLDLPGGNLLVPQRHPPKRGVEPRVGNHHFVNFPMELENSHWDDICCDDLVTIYTQYSTQWDALSHVGRHFDADGDGKVEPIYYNGFRAGVDVVGPEAADGPWPATSASRGWPRLACKAGGSSSTFSTISVPSDAWSTWTTSAASWMPTT